MQLWSVLYVVPMLNAVAALELTRIYDNREKKEERLQVSQIHYSELLSSAGTALGHALSSLTHGMAYQGYYFRAAVTVVSLTLFASFGFLRAAAKNYPGGTALMQLHELEFSNVTRGLRPFVHIDVAAAQLGASRFLEMPAPWRCAGGERRAGCVCHARGALRRMRSRQRASRAAGCTAMPWLGERSGRRGRRHVAVDGVTVGTAAGTRTAGRHTTCGATRTWSLTRRPSPTSRRSSHSRPSTLQRSSTLGCAPALRRPLRRRLSSETWRGQQEWRVVSLH